MEQKKITPIFNKGVQPVVEAKANPWGFEFLDNGGFSFTRDKVKITVNGNVPERLTGSLEIGLLIQRNPQIDKTQELRGRVDFYGQFYDDYVSRVRDRIRVDEMAVRAALNDFVGRLENYVQYLSKEAQIKPLQRSRGRHKPSAELTGLLHHRSTRNQVRKLVEESGIPATSLMQQLYELSFSRWMDKPVHVVLIGDQVKASLLLEQFSKLLPKQEYVSPPVLSERGLFEQKENYWSHRLILGQTLNALTEKSYLFNLLVHGSVERLSQKRKSAQIVQGPVQLIGIASSSNHPFLDVPGVIGLSIEEEQIDKEIMMRQLKEHSGQVDGIAEEKAKNLLKEFQQVDKPTGVTNPFLEQLDLVNLFSRKPQELQQFLSVAATMAIAGRKWEFGCTVSKKDMLEAAKLLKTTWDTQLGLSDVVSQTFKAIEVITEKKTKFTTTDVRNELLTENPRTVRRHVELLHSKEMIKKVGGSQGAGFIYELASSQKGRNEENLWNELLEQIKNLK
jgi:hypothetical protein